MSAEIKQLVEVCETCRKFETNQQKETLLPHDIPSHPWEKVGTDLFEFKNKNDLITVKTAKQLIRKAYEAGTDPYLAILDYRNTPTQGVGSSPAQRLMSRRTKPCLQQQTSSCNRKLTSWLMKEQSLSSSRTSRNGITTVQPKIYTPSTRVTWCA